MKFNIPILTRIWEIYKERQQYRKQLQHRLLRRRKKPDEKTLECGHWTDRFLKAAKADIVFTTFTWPLLMPIANWKWIFPLCFLMALLAYMPVMAREDNALGVDSITALKVGDKVPDLVFENIINYKSGSARLSDFKGKLVILDFWATWCSACVKHMPDMTNLQREFGEDLQIIMVNVDAKANTNYLNDFLTKHLGLKSAIPLVLKQGNLKSLFPYNTIPHYVWISPNAELLAITGIEELTNKHVSQAIKSGGNVKLVRKLNLDLSKPLFLSDEMQYDQLQSYSLLMKGYISGPGSGTHQRRVDGKLVGMSLTNKSMQRLFRFANEHLYQNEVVPMLVPPLSKDGSVSALDWSTILWSLDLQVGPKDITSIYQQMLNLLNAHSPYKAVLSTDEMPALALERMPGFKPVLNTSESEDVNEWRMQKQPSLFLVNYLNSLGFLLPVVDEMNTDELISLHIKGETNNLDEINLQLKRYGLQLKKETHAVRQFKIFRKETDELHSLKLPR